MALIQIHCYLLSQLARRSARTGGCVAARIANFASRALQISRARVANFASEKKSSDFIFGAQIFI
jgi:hypothetical protein